MSAVDYISYHELKRQVVKECMKLREHSTLTEKNRLYDEIDSINPHSSFKGLYGILAGRGDHCGRAKKLLHFSAVKYSYYNTGDKLIPIEYRPIVNVKYDRFPFITEYVRKDFSALEYYLCLIYNDYDFDKYKQTLMKIVRYICNLKTDLLTDEL